MSNSRIEIQVDSDDGKHFNISFNQGDIRFEIFELTISEIQQIFEDIENQIVLLKECYFNNLNSEVK